jgi:hypothetical protein
LNRLIEPLVKSTGYGRYRALIRFFFHEDADDLTDEQYVTRMFEVDVVAESLGWERKNE